MSSNELGSWAIHRRQQPIRFRLVAARVSLRMALDACTAAPRAPHGWLHVQDTCRTPPLLPDVRLHDWNSCKAPQHHTHGWPHASNSVLQISCFYMSSCITHRTSVGVRQHTQDVRGCPCVSVCVRQQTQDVRGCPSVHISARWSLDSARWPFPLTVRVILAHVGCLFSTHRTSVGVRQHTKDVRGCPCVSVSTHRTAVAVHQYSYQHAGPWTQHAGPSRGLFGTSVAVRQHTQNIRGCPSVHISARCTHIRTLALSVNCSCTDLDMSSSIDGLDCQSQPSVLKGKRTEGMNENSFGFNAPIRMLLAETLILAHVGCLFSTHRTSVGVRQHTHKLCGCLWLSVSTHRISVAVRVCPCLSVCVRQYTQDIRGCPCVSVFVRVCPLVHTGCPWLSISTDIRTMVLQLSMLALFVDCSGDFGPRGLSVQYTQDVSGCPPAHIGRLWLSVCVRGCPPAHTRRLWLSVATVSTHMTSVCVRQYTQDVCGCPSGISTLVLGLSTLALPVDCLGDFGPRGLSVQYTQDIRGCPSAHRTSVAVRKHTHDVRGCPCVSVYVRVCPSEHTRRLWLSISTHISMMVLGLSMLALHVDCSGDFGPRGLSVQYTQDVRGYPSAHTGRPCVSVSTHRTSVALRVCPSAHTGCPLLSIIHTGRLWVSASTHRTLVAVRVCPCPSAHTGRPWLSISTHIRTLVLGLRTLALLGDFSPRGLSVQYTQDIRGCSPAHTRLLWLSVAIRQHTKDIRGCPCVYVCVRQHTQDVRGCPSVHISARWSFNSARWPFPWTVRVILAHAGCHICTHKTFVDVRQHTQDFCVCPSAHTGRLWLSVFVRVSPSAHTGCLWLSIRTHISTLYTQDVRGYPQALTGRLWQSVALPHTGRLWLSISTHICTLALPVDCSGDFGPCGLSVQYTQSASTHRTSVAVRVCPPAHMKFVAVHLYPYQNYTQDVRGCSAAHTGLLWLSVAIRQHTQDICGCPCVSVFFRVCPSAHTRPPWLSNNTYISTMVLQLSTWTTWAVCSVHKRHPWVSVSTHRTSVAVCGCPSAHTGRPGLSVCVHVCLSAHTRRPWLSISTHISMMVLGLSTLALPVDCSGDFGPSGLSVQYTQDVRGYPSANKTSVCVRQHTQDVRGSPYVSVCVRQHTQDVCCCPSYTQDIRGCPPAHTGRLWLSVCVRVCPSESVSTQDVRGCPSYTQDVRRCSPAHTGLLWLSVAIHQHTQDIRGCPSVSVCVRQHTQDVCGCPSIHISTQWSFNSTHWPFPWTVRVILTHLGCLFCTHKTFVGVRQQTQDFFVCPSAHTGSPWLSVSVRVCPSAHTGRLWLSIRTYISTLVLGISMLTLPVDWSGDFALVGCPFSTHRTSVGRLWLSISTHISTMVLGVSTLALPVDCSGDFGPRGLSVQYTQDVRGYPSAHTGRLCVSVSTYRASVCVRQHTQDVHGSPCVSVSTHMTSVAVHQYTYQDVGPWIQHADPSCGLFG
ncbi:hypothetical protein YC2023_066382 [Brassica napus]